MGGLLATAPVAGAVTLAGARAKALKATTSERARGGVILFGLRSPVRAGASVREAGRRSGAAGLTMRTMLVAGATNKMRMKGEPAFFFHLDRGAYQATAHAGRVVLVGARSGRVLRGRVMQFSPAIDGRPPPFLRSRDGYESGRYRVFSSPYAVAAATARAVSRAGLGPFGFSARSVSSEAVVAARLNAEKSCTVIIGGRRVTSVGALGSPSQPPVIPLLVYSPSSTTSPASLIATDAIAGKGCRDIVIAISGDGYTSLSPPSIRTHVTTSGARMREYHVSAGTLRSIIAANPLVTLKLMLDAPGSGAFIEALQSLGNLLVVATSLTASQTAFHYPPAKRVGGALTPNPVRMRSDSSFFTTLLFGGAAFAGSDAEVAHAAAEVPGPGGRRRFWRT